jgi:heme oxygenase (biliverdin-IX-beta and delta-forming)
LHRELDVFASRLDLRHRADYCHYLLASAGPIIGLECALESSHVEAVFADWDRRRRRFALAQDLHALGLSADPVALAMRLSPSMTYGVLYVLEGSRLGAQTLLPKVDESTDQSVLAARHFLRANDPTLWLSYLRALEAAPMDIDVREMLAAARYTFTLFNEAFATYAERAESSASAQRAAVRYSAVLRI